MEVFEWSECMSTATGRRAGRLPAAQTLRVNRRRLSIIVLILSFRSASSRSARLRLWQVIYAKVANLAYNRDVINHHLAMKSVLQFPGGPDEVPHLYGPA